MIPNNKYYKDIAVILGYEWDNKHHSSLVYMKEIAMAYGYSYETTKPSNKFLKDWHTGLTGETPSDHKYNLWYLRGIAEFLGSSTGLNENQCLAYIKDNIENPPSEFDSIALTVATPILSYVDGDSTSLSAQLMNGQEEAHLSGKSVSFDIVDSQGNVVTHIGDGVTNTNGLAVSDNDYVSSGVGDVTIQASVGSLQSETYTIEDCVKAYMNTYSSSSPVSLNYSLPSNYKMEFILNGSSQSDSEYSAYIRFDSSAGSYVGKGGSASQNISVSGISQTLTLPSNTDTEYIFTKNNGAVSLTDGTNTISGTSNNFTRLDHVKAGTGATLKNIKIKPLPAPTYDGISLSVDESTIVYGESVTLTAQLTSDGSPVSISDRTVSFYDGETLIGSEDTDSTGVATFTSSNFDVGSHSVTGVCDEYTSNSVSVTVDKLTPSISLSVPATGTMGSAYTISGTLVPSSGEVKLYEDNTLIDTLSVTGGVFSKSITQNTESTYSYYVVFEGSSTYDSITSSTSSIVITKLPVEYQEVEYIENTGTSYIDTGFKPNNNTRTYIRFYAGTLGTNVRAIFGSRDDTTYNDSYASFYLGSNTTSTGRMRVDYYNANSNNVYLFRNTSDKTEYELDYNKNIVTLNGATHTFTPQTFNSNNNIFLFTCNSGGIGDNRMMIGKIYACKIWDNEVLIRDLIPCYRISDNVIGLYDIVNDVFYTNSGTGTFSKGADV